MIGIRDAICLLSLDKNYGKESGVLSLLCVLGICVSVTCRLKNMWSSEYGSDLLMKVLENEKCEFKCSTNMVIHHFLCMWKSFILYIHKNCSSGFCFNFEQ